MGNNCKFILFIIRIFFITSSVSLNVSPFSSSITLTGGISSIPQYYGILHQPLRRH